MEKTRIGVLGATGAVGQRIVRMLEGHPWFTIAALAGSPRTTGKLFGETLRPTGGGWSLSNDVLNMQLVPGEPRVFAEAGCELVFSALPAESARDLEPAMARAGLGVISNASTHRPLPDVPLIVPEVNPDHIEMIHRQRRERDWSGFIVTNPNCSTIALTMALAPLHRAFGIEQVMVTTLQAISGAGFNGVSGLDIIDNVIPYIGGEEDKVETEPLKLLSTLGSDGTLTAPDMRVSAQCTRVPTTDGHLEMVSVKLSRQVAAEDVLRCWEKWRPAPQQMDLPTAPDPPLIVRHEPNRPQTRLDRDNGSGMAVTIGRLRPCPLLDYKFALLGHNLVRGAAGGVLLIAELLRAGGFAGGGEPTGQRLM